MKNSYNGSGEYGGFAGSGMVLLLVVVLFPGIAFSHTSEGLAGGALNGFFHPMNGLDHVLAMLAVGMWGAQLGAPYLWALPVAFPMIMAMGGVLGILGIYLPLVEPGIVVSVIALGLLIAFRTRPPVVFAALIVSCFAVFHGYAHGTELPDRAGAMFYSFGFVVSTGLIHLAGVLIGLVTLLPSGHKLLRAGGGAIGLTGLYLFINMVNF